MAKEKKEKPVINLEDDGKSYKRHTKQTSI
jgi:hypothetical protein